MSGIHGYSGGALSKALQGALDVGTTSFLRRSIARFTPFRSGSVAQHDVKVLRTSGSVDLHLTQFLPVDDDAGCPFANTNTLHA